MALRSLTSDGTEAISLPSASPARPLLSIVVPTRNEAGNVGRLIARLEDALPTVAVEIIFVDDSDDGTPEVIERLARRCTREMRAPAPDGGAAQQRPRRRGRRGACARRAAPWVCVMDADLQHPPELVEALLEQRRAARRSTSWSRAASARTATRELRLRAPMASRSHHARPRGCFPAPPARRHATR